MAEELFIYDGDKEEKYKSLLPQLKSLVDSEAGFIANAANFSSALHLTFGHLWTGFYMVKDDELVLGPFQGPIACTRIGYGKGVCGTAWKEGRTITVHDVNEFPGHIACSSLSRSEIVVPVFRCGVHENASEAEIIAVLDIDSASVGTFDETDKKFLEKICSLLA